MISEREATRRRTIDFIFWEGTSVRSSCLIPRIPASKNSVPVAASPCLPRRRPVASPWPLPCHAGASREGGFDPPCAILNPLSSILASSVARARPPSPAVNTVRADVDRHDEIAFNVKNSSQIRFDLGPSKSCARSGLTACESCVIADKSSSAAAVCHRLSPNR